MEAERQILTRVHELRMQRLWGKKYDALAQDRWPQNDKEWRQTEHGAPWDTNVEVAKSYLALARQLNREGLLAETQG